MKRFVYRRFNRLRFKQKLFLSYLLVILIPIGILGVYSFDQTKDLLYRQSTEGIQKNVATTAGSINGKIGQYNQMIHYVLYNTVIQRILANQYVDLVNLSRDYTNYLDPTFNVLSLLNKELEQMTIYTRNGMPERGNYILAGERIAGEPWYEQALAGNGGITWSTDNKRLYAASRFSTIADDPTANVLYVRLQDVDVLGNLAALSRDYGVFAADDSEDVLFASAPDAMRTAFEYGDVAGKEGVVSIRGTKTFLIKQSIPEAGWTIYCYVPAAQITGKADRILNATLVVIAVCIVILLLIISIFSNTMLRRIFQLNSWMKEAEAGNLNLRVHSTSQDEIGELTNRFGHMLARINDLIREAYANKIVQREAELKALRSQISPHFLYNTLSFINWKAVRSKAHGISHMVTTLSKFYRTALNKGDNVILVRDEIENVKSYVEIMLAMSDHRFQAVFEIDEAVCDRTTINFILQPLVENAIKHGLNRMKEGSGLLKVTAGISGSAMTFTVEDNGAGIAEEKLKSLLDSPSGGYGLKNVNERIQLMFGSAFGIAIKSAPGQGTAMNISVPLPAEPG
ncbi:sensor histidine kinase [Paenibacillus sp. MBLB4367]|uniref:sensor histidine kinase n=1 Tax=Paenibacillus sp. MBLB4367 TaxID=3384767 RepID=UPI0039082DCD